MNSASTAHTGDLFSYEYGCKHRPFHGGDVAAIQETGNQVQIVVATDTPAGYMYSFRTVSPVPAEVRKHFDLEII